jgi:putative DNA primase/helicase
MRAIARDLADRLGLKKHPRSWRGDCPACSYPRVFALRQGRGDRLQAFCANGCNRDELNDALQRVTNGTWIPAQTSAGKAVESARADKRGVAIRLWNGSCPASGTLADRYLTGRVLPGLAASAALRFRPDTWHPEGGRFPALIGLVSDLAGKPLAVHRTYLSDNGRKASAEPAKASLGPVWGGAIRLQQPKGGPLVIGEGVETSASAGVLAGSPAWAALSAGNLANGLQLPPELRDIIIAVDPDPAGENAARAARVRWMQEGRRVRFMRPTGPGDFNDTLRDRAHALCRILR